MKIGLKDFDITFIQINDNYRENLNFLLSLFSKKDILHFEHFGALYYTYDIKPVDYSNKTVFIYYDTIIRAIEEINITRSNKILSQKELDYYTSSQFTTFIKNILSANNKIIFYTDNFFDSGNKNTCLLIENFDIYNINKFKCNFNLGSFTNQFNQDNKQITTKLKEYFNSNLRGLKIKKIGINNT